ncbi:ribokinase [Anaerotignum lactatifermentans]|uniref:Ribokinase n=1 Tax=Anaerotignum lactatifermentans TaxID=160404 RepID=A0ABS2G879_9FIRM|nr:ribokinase [Anaerotignum lactatifermentans]MBM6828414.1 ribokinase [Anaerotignum lactatifermentans]MBM6877694.1 ribokinase [Anaerotignum lactatifermentans]MBM6949997.1 ribokinase [Anaerotignum lactatifermentans]
MKILNFGSMNLDYVYRVDTFIQPGETKSSQSLMVNCGGKGLNQSIAAAKAGNEVYHCGIVGNGGEMLEKQLKENGVNTSLLDHSSQQCGHAIIQVDDKGQNCILLYGGTNQLLTEEYIDRSLDAFGHEGLVLLQNETNLVGHIIAEANKRGLKTALNAAPMDEGVASYPLDLLDWLIVNEVEGKQIAGCTSDDDIIPVLREKYPSCSVLLTLGSRGARCFTEGREYRIGCFDVDVVDTTAAGDTFSGYFLYGVLNGKSIPQALLLATTASAIAIGKSGASDSVPYLAQVEEAIEKQIFGTLDVEVLE